MKGRTRHTITIVFEVEDSNEYDRVINAILSQGGEIVEEIEEEL